ncbi:acetylornithine/succinyldiaminopimelate/putrescine aminotransferase [Motilibacter peucedani]|uniref:Acetylornithine/succinyldiaminopimelate/putresci ne aminotransferase n=1 Tax=Motilibacter peucedani TaxID=598650 RepID=A0A420XKI6_9ACTN|nr:aminotransferase class III-fold pyridoxal phosphate-dependent enzyme [Motilibacter peucedani]RKS67957.1 acetylornithine/succinyldiaminopimelate/putrescine aminotransferase [Motilibacter peucedani]
MTTVTTLLPDLPIDKDEVLELSDRFWNPGKTRFWSDAGVPLVIGERSGYVLTDMAGRELVDMHLNGGTYNLGHRNPELTATLVEALGRFDIGNHHFPSVARAALARELVASAPPGLKHVAYGSGGGEAIDIALKSARYATKRRKIVSIVKGYHGHTGLAVATGDARYAEIFLADQPDEFVQVPFNDLEAMEAALAPGDAAAVILETIPATYGFPMPAPGYLRAVKDLCDLHGTLYVADEVQTGLMRTGELWAISKHDVQPDVLVTAKGLSGGLYPVSAVLLGERAGGWLEEDGFAHISTFGGAELGCVVALKVLEMTQRVETAVRVAELSALFAERLGALRDAFPDWLVEVRQDGLVMGLVFATAEGAKPVMRALYESGVWAIFSSLDPRVLQWKPGLLLDDETALRVLDRLEAAVARTAEGHA